MGRVEGGGGLKEGATLDFVDYFVTVIIVVLFFFAVVLLFLLQDRINKVLVFLFLFLLLLL